MFYAIAVVKYPVHPSADPTVTTIAVEAGRVATALSANGKIRSPVAGNTFNTADGAVLCSVIVCPITRPLTAGKFTAFVPSASAANTVPTPVAVGELPTAFPAAVNISVLAT